MKKEGAIFYLMQSLSFALVACIASLLAGAFVQTRNDHNLQDLKC